MLMPAADHWSHDNRRQRLLAAVCAIALTILMGKQLNGGRFHWQQHSVTDAAGSVSYLALFNVMPSVVKPPEAAIRTSPQVSAHASARIETGAVRPAVSGAITSPSQDSALSAAAPDNVQETATLSAGSALKLDVKSIGKAYKDSRSDLQRMAEAAGKTLEAPPQTREQKFDAVIAEAAVPGCLAMGEDPMKHNPPMVAGVNLGGLLALPFYAGAIIKGKCK
ncbi:BF2992 family fimbrillin-A clan protein [Undibacterium sp. TJN25]|uniref:BF2992 family fimbrillin-A clan protein n=1 Tax=Undibacterium sp. TJN25 TaxID=3413056 RepID=UPI003BF3D741